MSFVKNKIARSKIQKLQIDPFGYCNAKCWFCPVRYKEQPDEYRQHMSIDLMEKIFSELTEEKNKPDGIVDPSFNLFLTAHYNEILLYKHFEEMLELARKFEFKTFVLSNGVALTREKIDIIASYKDVVPHVGLNIPAFEKELWAKRSGFNPDSFERLMDNLEYAQEQFAYMGNNFQIHINGVDDASFRTNILAKGPEFNSHEIDTAIRTGEHETQFRLAKKLFPKISMNKSSLVDRAGNIVNVLSNQKHLAAKISSNKSVVGCGNWGDRTTEWLHVNSLGQTFLCCNDYHFDYVYGNLNEQSLTEIWGSPKHVEVIENAYDNVCRKCQSAIIV